MISVIIPVFNESLNIPNLFKRLCTALDGIHSPYELVFINDGSTDLSLETLRTCHAENPAHVVIVDLQGNFGQHMAIMAGFEHARGEVCVTIDADLQNPPEEIYKLIDVMNMGYDYVGSYRDMRRGDPWYRHIASRFINYIREKTTHIIMRDQGCMLRAYSRSVVDRILTGSEHSTFIPALAYKNATRPTEVEVRHDERLEGESKYTFAKLVRLNFDLITNFSLAPLQAFTWIGMLTATSTGLLVIYLLLRRLILGPEVGGVFTLFALLFFLISLVIVGIGLVGEYVGRIFQNSRTYPRYVVRSLTRGSSRDQNVI